MIRRKMEQSRSRADKELIHYQTDGISLAVNSLAAEPEVEITAVTQALRCDPKSKIMNKFQCELCHTFFRRQDHVKRHMETVHAGRKTTLCPLCGLDCKDEGMLSHLQTSHPSNNKHFCSTCDFVADTAEQLEYHESSHTRKHWCDICNALFKRRDHLNRHIKSLHSNEFVNCNICEKIFKRRDHMLRHVREKHKMKGDAKKDTIC